LLVRVILQGYFASRIPTNEEIDTCRHIIFTSERPWDPYSQTFVQHEQAYQSTSEVTNHGEHFTAMGDVVWSITVGAASSHDRRSNVDPATLARQWGGVSQLPTKHLHVPPLELRKMNSPDIFRLGRPPNFGSHTFEPSGIQTRWVAKGSSSVMMRNGRWMCSKANCGDAFNQVVREYGIPELGIHTDNAGDRCIYRVGENPEALSHQANLY